MKNSIKLILLTAVLIQFPLMVGFGTPLLIEHMFDVQLSFIQMLIVSGSLVFAAFHILYYFLEWLLSDQ